MKPYCGSRVVKIAPWYYALNNKASNTRERQRARADVSTRATEPVRLCPGCGGDVCTCLEDEGHIWDELAGEWYDDHDRLMSHRPALPPIPTVKLREAFRRAA